VRDVPGERLPGGASDEVLQRRHVLPAPVEQHEPRRPGETLAGCARGGKRFTAGNDAAHLGMVQHVARFLHAELGIDGHHDGAEAGEREQREHVALVVARHHRDAVALAHAARGERARQLRGGCAEFSPAPRPARVEHEWASGIALRAAFERAAQGVVVLRIEPEHFERFFHCANRIKTKPRRTRSSRRKIKKQSRSIFDKRAAHCRISV
jgi:hypothetical protein